MDRIVVISLYKQSIKWTEKILPYVDKIYIYDHDSTSETFFLNREKYNYEKIPNKGCEASAYLKFFIDHYDSLPSKLMLIHDTEFSYHHKGSLAECIIQNINKPDMYINLKSFMWKKRQVDEHGHFNEFKPTDNYYKLYVRFLEPYLGKLNKYGDFLGGYKGCAQFIVQKKCITRNPLQMYIDLYKYCMAEAKVGHPPFGFGYFMEFTWNIIFGYRVDESVFKGSWKNSSRFVHCDDTHIYTELKKRDGSWVKAVIPKDREQFVCNINGNVQEC